MERPKYIPESLSNVSGPFAIAPLRAKPVSRAFCMSTTPAFTILFSADFESSREAMMIESEN